MRSKHHKSAPFKNIKTTFGQRKVPIQEVNIYNMPGKSIVGKNRHGSDFEYLKSVYWCLRLFWIWPPEHYDNLYIYKASVNIGSLLYYFFGVLMYVFLVLRDPEAKYSEIIDATSMAMAVLTLMYEYFVTMYLSKKMLEFFKLVVNFDNFGPPPNILAVNQYNNWTCLFLFIYCLVASFTTTVEGVFKISKCEQTARSKYTLCGFATIVQYPYDISDGFLYYSHVIMQMYWFSMLCAGGVSFLCASTAAIEFIIARIEHFKDLMRDLFKDGSPDRKKLGILVRYHSHIIELVLKFNNSYRLATAPALFNYSAVIGLTMLSFFAECNFKTILHPMGWIMAVLYMCYEGERIIQHSTSVAGLLYDLDWPEVDIVTQKDILFMLMRSQKALVFESGPLGEFSLATMKKIVQGAYTYKTLTSGIDTSG